MPSKIRFPVKLIVSFQNVVSIVDSSVSIDTQAEARLIAFEAEYTGLSYWRYFIMLIIANAIVINVYVAKVIVVISW